MNVHPLPEMTIDMTPEVRLSEPEREWCLRVVHATVWNDKAAHRRAIKLAESIAAGALSADDGRYLAELLNANLESARINGMGGRVLVPLTDRLEAALKED